MRSNSAPKSVNFADTKPHYELLDGLRGVAALLVLVYHIFEGFAFAESVNGEGVVIPGNVISLLVVLNNCFGLLAEYIDVILANQFTDFYISTVCCT